jgi:hypothetical protein
VTCNLSITVTPDLIRGPFVISNPACAARWMLKQVQHDENGAEASA